MEIDDIEAQITELQRVMGRMERDAADRMRSLAHADDLELFWIENKAGRKAYFWARSARFARHTAVSARHIERLENGECFRANASFFENNPGFGSSVKRAIKDRIPGHVIKKGNHAVLGEKVYSPMVEVK